MAHQVRAITHGPKHHFFGYYDQKPWDPTGRYHLVLEVDFMDRPPTGDDVARVALVDLHDDNRLGMLTETRAWNFQQGAMLHWHPARPKTILFNDRRDGRFVCVVHEIASGDQTILGPAIAALSEDGRFAATLNFARLATTRPGYGYEGTVDPWADQTAPSDDGVGLLDLATGEHRLLVSMGALAPLQEPELGYGRSKVWFNHVLINPSGTRLMFLCRPTPWDDPRGRITQLWTVGADGGELTRVLPGPNVSHCDWKDDRTLISWCGVDGQMAVWELDAMASPDRPARPLFTDTVDRDGHVCFSHNGRWVATDTYPRQDGLRRLSILEYDTGRKVDLGEYYSPRPPQGEIRCDLHPCWRDDDRVLAIDGIHEGTRQRYLVEIDT